uniref:Uncharacterized protein n=1 Tax=Arundo donax TaxID=35708 RepID=A0A0A8YG67_ARUDO
MYSRCKLLLRPFYPDASCRVGSRCMN